MLLTLLSVALLALSAQGPFDEGNSEGFLNLISGIREHHPQDVDQKDLPRAHHPSNLEFNDRA
uniref:Uncharacterized protein n=1 Tax=Phocoena sinus TaxID=42100 RepID=A0A8C9DZQ5_PHOSS